ncbi:hypothetical protein EJ03DRAFT_329186 [Teratosphaeria nubilosa]|uniref:Uncharacterized protein n=1 Tax=Teratosphaeria nubilosa TaxID=161662 RepID=A0A6G1L3B1_9PEZI|nr:hypothetical protein EJ03DRAFT_329186 [Teratosphaeria nubilosa]
MVHESMPAAVGPYASWLEERLVTCEQCAVRRTVRLVAADLSLSAGPADMCYESHRWTLTAWACRPGQA